jgi:hypothetical protein
MASDGSDRQLAIFEEDRVWDVVHQIFEQLVSALELPMQIEIVSALAHDPLQVIGIPGLGDVGEDAAVVHSADDRGQVCVPRHHHASCVARVGNSRQQLVSAHAGHPLIRDDDRDVLLLLDEPQRQQGRGCLQDRVSSRQLVFQCHEDLLVVVDDQDPLLFPAPFQCQRC